MPLERPEKPAGEFKLDLGTTLPDPSTLLPRGFLEGEKNMYDEIHDLPNKGEKTNCWLSISYRGSSVVIKYHYTLNGCYIIE